MKHIFVVDDESAIRELLKKYLEKEGYRVTAFAGSESVIEETARLKPDLLVFDIMMPGTDGLELCREIRMKSEIPIVFVSAKGEEVDRVVGLELGADDYLVKPFSPRELLVRIKNIFRRIERGHQDEGEISAVDVTISPSRRCVEKEGREVKLTVKEYDLLEALARHRGMPFTRAQLVEKVWGYSYFGDERVVDDLVKRIRKKLLDSGSALEITTVWGYGYKIDG